MLEEKDTTLQGTLSGTTSGTSSKTKMRNTADAQLRRKVVELNKRYKNPEVTKKVLYMLDGYSPEEIQTEMDGYDSIMSGKPIPQDEETSRVENRSRQMMYNEINSDISGYMIDESGEIKYDEKGEPMKFDPNDSNDVGMLKNEMAVNHPELSWEEINAAVDERTQVEKDKQPEGRGAVEEDNAGSDFDFGTWKLNPAAEGSTFKKIVSKVPGWEWVGGEEPKNEVGYGPGQEDIFQPPRQQVQGARFDNFRQGVEDKLSGTQTFDNTLGNPPDVSEVGAMQPGGPPPAEQRYPDKTVSGWDNPNESMKTSGLPTEEGKKTYEQARTELKDVDVLSKDYKPRTLSQVPEQEIESYKQYVREVFGDEADLAIQVMLEESKGIAEAIGDTDAGKVFDYKGEKVGDSVGLFQIRTGGKDWPTTKSRAEAEGIPLYQFRNNMLDPYQNIRYAKYLVDKEGWQLWSTYNTAKKKLNK